MKEQKTVTISHGTETDYKISYYLNEWRIISMCASGSECTRCITFLLEKK